MRPCPQCGAPTPGTAGPCPVCGVALPDVLAQTQMGHAPPHAAPSKPPSVRPTGPAALKATVMGMGMLPNTPSPGPVAPNPLAAPPASALRGTMIGMAPSLPTSPSSPPPAAPPAAAANPLRGTMIGMAPPHPTSTASPYVVGSTTVPLGMTAPTGFNAPPAGTTSSAADAPAGATDPSLSNAPVGKKTMIGIARPGIAPLHPGQDKPRPAATPPAAWPAAPPVPPLTASQPLSGAIPSAQAAGIPRPFRIPAVAALAIVGAAALLTAAVVALLLYRARGAVEASLTNGASGQDELALTCKGCPDGSGVTIDGAHAKFSGGRAEVALRQKLSVGENAVTVELERRPGKSEQIELKVPVDFRVRADTSGLTQSPPQVIVRVEAVPHAAVVVDGKPLALTAGPSGAETGSAEIDIARALTGPSSVVGMFERKIPYVVTPPDGAPTRGEVSVRVGVTPLVVQAPGPSIVIEASTFVLAGHTGKDATVTVEGRPITVDGAGAFAQMMSVSSLGETNVTVRADAKDQAPRLVPVRVRRVQSLVAEAAAVRASATTSYAAIERDPDSQRGIAVALDGSVVEARVDAFTTVLLLDVKSGCASPPCLARVSVGEKAPLKDGSNVSVFGTIAGAVDGPRSGSRIPALNADFVLKGRP